MRALSHLTVSTPTTAHVHKPLPAGVNSAMGPSLLEKVVGYVSIQSS
jgi:hypothetical protein